MWPIIHRQLPSSETVMNEASFLHRFPNSPGPSNSRPVGIKQQNQENSQWRVLVCWWNGFQKSIRLLRFGWCRCSWQTPKNERKIKIVVLRLWCFLFRLGFLLVCKKWPVVLLVGRKSFFSQMTVLMVEFEMKIMKRIQRWMKIVWLNVRFFVQIRD